MKRPEDIITTPDEKFLTEIDLRLSEDDQKFLAVLRRADCFSYKPDINECELTVTQKMLLASERTLKATNDPTAVMHAKIIHYLAGCDIDNMSESDFHEQITADIELLNLPVKIT